MVKKKEIKEDIYDEEDKPEEEKKEEENKVQIVSEPQYIDVRINVLEQKLDEILKILKEELDKEEEEE